VGDNSSGDKGKNDAARCCTVFFEINKLRGFWPDTESDSVWLNRPWGPGVLVNGILKIIRKNIPAVENPGKKFRVAGIFG
jgi:hypothetical protein